MRPLGGLMLLAAALCRAQAPEPAPRPLPDIPTLMHQVEDHEKASESLVKDYLYHALATQMEEDSHGAVKKTETEESDIFYIAGAQIERRTSRNGRPLSPEEQAKESERVDKEIKKAKARQSNPAQQERDIVTVSRFLELGSFGNARRVQLDGRDTIAVDFTGNPKAKTRNRFEGAIRDMEGTVWVDEQDRSLRKISGKFVNTFKVGGGLLANISRGSTFSAEWTKVNDEVWLPASASGHGDIRVLLLFNFHGTLRVVYSNYRRFKATATILPVTPDQQTAPPETTPPQ